MSSIEDIRARWAAATPGVWAIGPNGKYPGIWADKATLIVETFERDADGEALAHAPADVAALLSEVDRLTDDLARSRAFVRIESEAGDDLVAETVVLRGEIARLRAALAGRAVPTRADGERYVGGVELSYAHRYPEAAGRVLWCVDCGARCSAELLDWWQHCTDCAAWWRANPPPGPEHAVDAPHAPESSEGGHTDD